MFRFVLWKYLPCSEQNKTVVNKRNISFSSLQLSIITHDKDTKMIIFLVYWLFNLCLNKPDSLVMCETIRKMNINRYGETESLGEDMSCREN